MEEIIGYIKNLHSADGLRSLVQGGGVLALTGIIFAETGLLAGFFLPGDSLLVTAGIVAQRGHLDLRILIPLLIIAAITGDATGYTIGRRAGPLNRRCAVNGG